MRLGISAALAHTSPQDWAEKHKALGLECVVFPVDHTVGEEKIMEYKAAADEADLTIAEVGVWRNTLAADRDERERNIRYAIKQLEMAERIGARCCVNVVGTPYGPRWDGGYAENFSEDLWYMAVTMIQRIIDAVHPKHTKFTIESMPWMIPSSPDEYLRLIRDVDRTEFGVHLDVVNMITSPKRYFFNREFLEECFEKLNGKILSCHLKDILLKQEYTFQLAECACGQGTLDLDLYAKLATDQDTEMPMIIEHLASEAEYRQSVKYIHRRLDIFENSQIRLRRSRLAFGK